MTIEQIALWVSFLNVFVSSIILYVLNDLRGRIERLENRYIERWQIMEREK